MNLKSFKLGAILFATAISLNLTACLGDGADGKNGVDGIPVPMA